MQDHQANVKKKDDCVCIISLSFDLIPERADELDYKLFLLALNSCKKKKPFQIVHNVDAFLICSY